MSEQRLKNIESMLSQLISMVGNMHTEQTEMKEEQTSIKSDISSMKEEQTSMKNDISGMKEEISGMKEDIHTLHEGQQQIGKSLKETITIGNERHREIMDEFKIVKADQDHTWGKTVQNERAIAQLKHQVSN